MHACAINLHELDVRKKSSSPKFGRENVMYAPGRWKMAQVIQGIFYLSFLPQLPEWIQNIMHVFVLRDVCIKDRLNIQLFLPERFCLINTVENGLNIRRD